MKGEDSFSHIYSECIVVSNARASFFRNLSLDISPFSRTSPSSPLSSSPSISSECILPRKIHSCRLRNFIFSLMHSPSSSSFPSPLPSFDISPLAPETIGASLGPTFLIDIPRALVQPVLAFNFAVWKYRKPARAAAPVRGLEWIVSRIAESATNLISCFKSKKRKAPLAVPLIEPSISNHNSIVSSSDSSVAICYTDGSASPNPGPGGAGVAIFLRNLDVIVDAGASTGYCTNNIAELAALLICFSELLRLFALRAFNSAIIFCDSSYAINQATGSKVPSSNRSLTLRLREAYNKSALAFDFKLIWLKGHSTAGGNIRVDFLAKTFASCNIPNALSFDANSFFTYSCSSAPWVYGYPLITVPLKFFIALFNYFPWPSYPCLSAIDYTAPVAILPSLPGSPKRRKLSRLKTAHDKPVSAVRRSKRLALARSSPRASPCGFYITDLEPLDFKHPD
jgi:ribonuclease HI